jgi:catechol 2,3-dioxygenase-like lactoylglutathione lyase family enzyme
MTELVVSDWADAVAWYRDILGLELILLDAQRRFALLGDDRGRLALKGGPAPAAEERVRLTFRVDDLDAAFDRLRASGAATEDIRHEPREGYRSFRMIGPERITITIFAWDQPETSGKT